MRAALRLSGVVSCNTMMRSAMLLRLTALVAGAIVAGFVALANGPTWADVGFGCLAGLGTYLVVQERG